MSGGPWTEDERREARLSAVALLRAGIAGDRDGARLILDSAGGRGVRCIAETLLPELLCALARLTGALSVIEDDVMRETAATAPDEALLAQPAIRAALEERIAAVQASIVREELG